MSPGLFFTVMVNIFLYNLFAMYEEVLMPVKNLNCFLGKINNRPQSQIDPLTTFKIGHISVKSGYKRVTVASHINA